MRGGTFAEMGRTSDCNLHGGLASVPLNEVLVPALHCWRSGEARKPALREFARKLLVRARGIHERNLAGLRGAVVGRETCKVTRPVVVSINKLVEKLCSCASLVHREQKNSPRDVNSEFIRWQELIEPPRLEMAVLSSITGNFYNEGHSQTTLNPPG